jgi:hypothetical protein
MSSSHDCCDLQVNRPPRVLHITTGSVHSLSVSSPCVSSRYISPIPQPAPLECVTPPHIPSPTVRYYATSMDLGLNELPPDNNTPPCISHTPVISNLEDDFMS